MKNKTKEAIILTGVISRLFAPVPGNLCFLGRSRCALSIGCSFAFGHGKAEICVAYRYSDRTVVVLAVRRVNVRDGCNWYAMTVQILCRRHVELLSTAVSIVKPESRRAWRVVKEWA
jgi:hypothetical protein